MEKGFFKVFLMSHSSQRLKIPATYTDYRRGNLPTKISLRDRYGNMWPIGLAKIDGEYYFEDGWRRFIEENTIESGDFLIFNYEGNSVFNFKLLEPTRCEKKGVGGLRVVRAEELNEHKRNEDQIDINVDSDRNDSSDSDKNDEEYMVEEYDEHEKEIEEANEKDINKEGIASLPKAIKMKETHDIYGVDIFKSRRATQPINPYFVSKIRENKINNLYIPVEIVKDYNLKFPQIVALRDPVGREFNSTRTIWKDGRIWLCGGWRNLYKINLVEKEDSCICEFVPRKNGLYIQVHIVRQASSSHHQQGEKHTVC